MDRKNAGVGEEGHSNDMPGVLYKYLAPERIDVIEELRIRVTQLSALNDPHECFAALNWLAFANAPDRRENFLRSVAARYGATPEQAAAIRNMWGALVQTGILEHAIAETNPLEKMRRQIDAYLGVLCLSKTVTDARMWSHYAAGNRGYCIGFDVASSLVSGTSEAPAYVITVQYKDNPPMVELGEAGQDIVRRAILGTKSRSWEGEQEIRVVHRLTDAGVSRGDIDAAGFPVLLRSVPPESVREVILGARASESLEARVRASCARHGFKAAIRKVVVSQGSYDLGLVDVHVEDV